MSLKGDTYFRRDEGRQTTACDVAHDTASYSMSAANPMALECNPKKAQGDAHRRSSGCLTMFFAIREVNLLGCLKQSTHVPRLA